MSKSKTSSSLKRDYWQKHIDCWAASGLTQKQYCVQEKINRHNFTWWRTRRLKNKSKIIVQNKLAFIPAVIKESQQPTFEKQYHFTLIFPNQLKLLIPQNIPENDFVNFIKSLGGLS